MVDLTYPENRDPISLAKLFRYFGEVETPRLNSNVYTAYSLGVAEDPEILALAAQVLPSQPPPNVLYAAVKDLLLGDSARSEAARDLARFYPSISGAAIPDESPWPAFRRFCVEHAADLEPGLKTGRTQTCVVHRSAVILPAIASLPRVRAADGRVGFLEIGPSAGLNLRLDRYRYAYHGHAGSVSWGATDARPVLECELRGEFVPPMPEKLDVVARRGLELAPIDLADPLALRWLRALIWPEHIERVKLMEEALAVAAEVPVVIEAGDATKDIEAAIQRLPTDAPRVVFATHAVYQMSEEGVLAMTEGVAAASHEVPVDFIIMESDGSGASQIEWLAFEAGALVGRKVVARSDSHGRWLAWGPNERS